MLLVEDSAANRLVAATILEKAGYVVDIAENGQQAIEAAAHRHHDMVLMDLQMPVMDGYSAAERIRQSFEDDWRVPIVALTANVPARPQGQARAVAFDGYIAKPYSRSILLDAVASQLGPRGAREELPAGRTGADGKVLS